MCTCGHGEEIIFVSFYPPIYNHMGSPDGSMVKNAPANEEMQETWVQSLGREDLLEKEMATHSSILAWEIPLADYSPRVLVLGQS